MAPPEIPPDEEAEVLPKPVEDDDAGGSPSGITKLEEVDEAAVLVEVAIIAAVEDTKAVAVVELLTLEMREEPLSTSVVEGDEEEDALPVVADVEEAVRVAVKEEMEVAAPIVDVDEEVVVAVVMDEVACVEVAVEESAERTNPGEDDESGADEPPLPPVRPPLLKSVPLLPTTLCPELSAPLLWPVETLPLTVVLLLRVADTATLDGDCNAEEEASKEEGKAEDEDRNERVDEGESAVLEAAVLEASETVGTDVDSCTEVAEVGESETMEEEDGWTADDE